MGVVTSKLKEIQDEFDKETLKIVLYCFKSGDYINVSLIQRRCRRGYYSSSRVLNYMIDNGMVEKRLEFYYKIL